MKCNPGAVGKNPDSALLYPGYVLTYITYLLDNVRNKGVTLLLPDEFIVDNVALIG